MDWEEYKRLYPWVEKCDWEAQEILKKMLAGEEVDTEQTSFALAELFKQGFAEVDRVLKEVFARISNALKEQTRALKKLFSKPQKNQLQDQEKK